MKGFIRRDLGFFISKIPERKKPVIMLRKDNANYVIGQVRSVEDGELLIKTISYVMLDNEQEGDFVRDTLADWDNQ